jgi:hypothetical protein
MRISKNPNRVTAPVPEYRQTVPLWLSFGKWPGKNCRMRPFLPGRGLRRAPAQKRKLQRYQSFGAKAPAGTALA